MKILTGLIALLTIALGANVLYLKNAEFDYWTICGTTTTSLGSNGTDVLGLSYGSNEKNTVGWSPTIQTVLVAASVKTEDNLTGGDVEIVPVIEGAKITDTIRITAGTDFGNMTSVQDTVEAGESLSWEVVTENADPNSGDDPILCAVFRWNRRDF